VQSFFNIIWNYDFRNCHKQKNHVNCKIVFEVVCQMCKKNLPTAAVISRSWLWSASSSNLWLWTTPWADIATDIQPTCCTSWFEQSATIIATNVKHCLSQTDYYCHSLLSFRRGSNISQAYSHSLFKWDPMNVHPWCQQVCLVKLYTALIN